MAPLPNVALRACARCVIRPPRPRAGRQRSSALFLPHAGHHQRQPQQVSPMFPVYSVTYVPGCTHPTHPFNSDFRREIRDRGYVEGQNFILELRSLEGRMERASEAVAELVRLNVDVIVTVTAEM